MKYNFSEILADETKLGKKISQGDYLVDGQFPIIDQGQKKIAGYSNETDGLFRDVPAIIFGDHTRVLKFVNKPFFLGADGVKLLKQKRNEDNAKYLFYALKNVKIPNTGYNRHFKWLKEAHIEIPKRKQQDAVVKILDSITALISLRQRQAEKLDELVKARFVEMFGEGKYGGNPLSNVCKLITDGTHQPPQFVDAGIPFLLVSNLVHNEITYDTEKFISKESYQELIKRTPVEIGDILLSIVGSYGHAGVVRTDKPFCFQRHIAYIKPDFSKLNSEFLHHALLSDAVKYQMEKRVKGIAQKTLNLSELKKIVVPIPPLALQTEFSHFVHEVDREKERIQRSAALLETLKRSLMQQYFG